MVTFTKLRSQTNWRTLAAGSLKVFLSLFLLSFFTTGFAQINVNGNPNDWPSVYTTSSYTMKIFVHDANDVNDNSFTTGSQDPDLISEWGWVNGNTNDKGDITNAGAFLNPSTNVLYFFGDRTAINGDAQIGFWFFKKNVGPLSDFTFGPDAHQNGDILVLSNFTNGGGRVNLQIYMWENGALTFKGSTADNASLGDAAVNSEYYPVPAPGPFPQVYQNTTDTWTYQGKSVPSGAYNNTAADGQPTGTVPANTYAAGAFFEGQVNLANIVGATPCIAAFLLETRNSSSVNASLQDLVASGFNGVPTPTNTSMTACSTTPGGSTAVFDLTTKNSVVTGGVSGVSVVGWYTGYNSSTGAVSGPIADPANFTNTTNPQTVYALIQTTSTCTAVAQNVLTVYTTPAGTNTTMTTCPSAIGGTTASFDLTTKNSVVTGGASGVSVEGWYTGYNSTTKAFSGAIADPANFTNTTNPQTVYAKLSGAGGCIGVAQNVLTVKPSPTGTNTSMSKCPASIGGNTASFDLTTKNSTVTGGVSGVSVVGWYTGYNSTTNAFSGPIADPTAFTNTTNPQTVYAKLSLNDCIGVAQNVLSVSSSPVGTNTSMTQCPATIGGNTASFDLTTKNSVVTGGVSGVSVVGWYTGYNSTTNAFSGPIATPTAFTNTTNPQTVYAKLDAGGCYGVANNVLTVRPSPVGTNTSMTLCSTNEQGTTATFNLTTKNSVVTGGVSGVSVVGWYTGYNSTTNAFSGPIATPTAFTNTTNPQTVYAKLSGTGDCIGVAQNVLNVNPRPSVTVSAPSVCPEALSTTISATPNPSTGTYSYAWTVPTGVADPGNVSSFTTSVPGLYSVVITNTSTNCASDAHSATFAFYPDPVINIDDVTMNGSAVQFQATTTDGTPPYTWLWTALDGVINFTDPTVEDASGTMGTTTAVAQVQVTDHNGCIATAQTDLVVELDNYCTYTQGYYGNVGGMACDGTGNKYSTYATITRSINAQAGVTNGGVLTIGWDHRNITITAGDNATVTATSASLDVMRTVQVLPGGGGAKELPNQKIAMRDINSPSNTSLYLKNGRINNSLLAQTITLAINAGIQPNLSGLVLEGTSIATAAPVGGCGGTEPVLRECQYDPITGALTGVKNDYRYRSLDANVLTALDPTDPSGRTVGALLDLANRALDNHDGITGTEDGVSLTAIMNTVDAINNAFDGCRILIGFDVPQCPSTNPAFVAPVTRNAGAVLQDVAVTELRVSAYPNPFDNVVKFTIESPVSGQAQLEVFNMLGQKVASVYNGYIQANKAQVVEFKAGTETQQNLVYLFRIGSQQVTGKLLNVRR